MICCGLILKKFLFQNFFSHLSVGERRWRKKRREKEGGGGVFYCWRCVVSSWGGNDAAETWLPFPIGTFFFILLKVLSALEEFFYSCFFQNNILLFYLK